MRRLFYAFALALAIPTLAGCETLQVQDAPLAGTTIDEKALYVAEAAFDGVSQAIKVAARSGILDGAKATQVDALYVQAKNALDVARTAQRSGDSGTLLSNALLTQELVTKIFGLLK